MVPGRMKKPIRIKGRVVSGARRAAGFTQLDWVQDQCWEKLGFRPFPGTLNVEVVAEDLSAVEALEMRESEALIPPDPAFCEAKVFPLSMGAVSGVLILPAKDARIHEQRVVEIMAPVNLRETLELKDGDPVTIVIGTREIVQ